MFELGCHMVDRVVDFLGRPRATKSWIRHDTSRPDKLADNTLAVFEYERALGLIVSSALMPNQTEHRWLEVIGSDGSIMIQPMEPVPRMRVNMRRDRGPYNGAGRMSRCRCSLDTSPISRSWRERYRRERCSNTRTTAN
jgi:predicted dehydrogenase